MKGSKIGVSRPGPIDFRAAKPDHGRAGYSRQELDELSRSLNPDKYGIEDGWALWCDNNTVVMKMGKRLGRWQLCRVHRGLIKQLLDALAQIQPKRFTDAHITAIVPPRHLSTGRTHISEFASPSYTLVELDPILEQAEKIRRHPSQQTLDAVLDA